MASSKTTLSDPETGRTIHRLTSGGVHVSPYFNSWGWTPEGDCVFFFSLRGDEFVVVACEVETGHVRELAGPFPLPTVPWDIGWPTLNALPTARGVTFAWDGRVWRADLDGGKARDVARLPSGGRIAIGDTDVSGDGQWHTMGCIQYHSQEVLEEAMHAGWPPDAFFAKHRLTTRLVRVDLTNGEVQTLWEVPTAVSHVSVCPTDPDLILFCHEGDIPYRQGRMHLQRIGESESRPVRDQRTGRVLVTHERWFADGRRIAYHGCYLSEDRKTRLRDYVGVFDLDRDLPHEYAFADTEQRSWHASPSPDGRRLVMDQRAGGAPGLFLLTPDPATGSCNLELLTSIHSVSDRELYNNQWRELDPIWSPDGRRVLFRAARDDDIDVYVVEVDG